MNTENTEIKTKKKISTMLLIINLIIALIATAVCLAINLTSAITKESELKNQLKEKYNTYTNGTNPFFNANCGCGSTTMTKFKTVHPDIDSYIEHYTETYDVDQEEFEAEWTLNIRKIKLVSFSPIIAWVGAVFTVIIVLLFIKIFKTYSLNNIFDVFLAITLIICGGLLIYAAIKDISYFAKDISKETFASSAYAELEDATKQVASNVEQLGNLIENIAFYVFTLGGSIMIVCGLRKLANLWFNLSKR